MYRSRPGPASNGALGRKHPTTHPAITEPSENRNRDAYDAPALYAIWPKSAARVYDPRCDAVMAAVTVRYRPPGRADGGFGFGVEEFGRASASSLRATA